MRTKGQSLNKIALELRYNKVLIPSMYAAKKGYRVAAIKSPRSEYLWTHGIIRKILTNQSYIGDIVNFKTYSKSFKLKQRLENPQEKWTVIKGAHPAIIKKRKPTIFSGAAGEKLSIKPGIKSKKVLEM